MTEPDARPVRVCDLCGGVDDHPRHVIALVPADYPGAVPDPSIIRGAYAAGAPDSAVAELLDASSVSRHMDCCAERGCDVCPDAIRGADGATGDALLAHIQREAR